MFSLGIDLLSTAAGGLKLPPDLSVFLKPDGTYYDGLFYDFSRSDTLFVESTGNTPTASGQLVGLALDSRTWQGRTLEQELREISSIVLNGTFDSDTDWSKDVGITIADGVAKFNVDAIRSLLQFRTNANTRHYLSIDILNLISGSITARMGNGGGGLVASTNGRHQMFGAIPGGSNGGHTCQVFSGGAANLEVDNFVIKPIPGNHCAQTASASRGTLQAGGIWRGDGVDDHLLSNLAPSGWTEGTIGIKFKQSAGDATDAVIGSSVASGSRFWIQLNSSNKISGGIGGTIVSSANSYNGILSTAFLTTNGNTMRLYVDGIQVATANHSGGINSSLPFVIGGANNGSPFAFAAADLYKAFVIRKSITDSEIQAITNHWNS